jgi:hypothetical protein
MSSLNPRTADGGQVSIWTVMLSSSVALAMITGLFYFVGGAMHLGYSQALGLDYLAERQPAEYIFEGGQVLLASSSFILVLAIALAVFIAPMRLGKQQPFLRNWELLILFALTGIPSVLVWVFLTRGTSRDVITNSSCPIVGHGSTLLALSALVAIIPWIGIFSHFFFTRLLRLTFLVWGIVTALLCLFEFGLVNGEELLYGPFQVAEIASTSLSAGIDTRVLVLGADDKNLVILVPGENRTGHPEPRYLLRSAMTTVRIVGSSSINDFFCKRPGGTLK